MLQEQARRAQGQGIVVFSSPCNAGKGHAVKSGVAQCDGDLVCFIGGDLAYSLDHLAVLADGLRSCDVVIGSRNLSGRRQKNIHRRRRVLGWVFNRLARWILHLTYRDTQAGLKGFRREVAQRLFRQQGVRGFAFDAELLFLARRYGYSIAEVPAEVSEGHSYKITKLHLLRDSVTMFGALARIRYHSLRGAYD